MLIASVEQGGTGQDYRNIQYFHIFDPPTGAKEFVQNIGRTVRFGSHGALPLKDRKVIRWLARSPALEMKDRKAISIPTPP